MGWGQVAVATNDSVVTSVYSSVSNGYIREKLPDGSLRPETYVVGNGGYVAGTSPHPSADDVPFPTIVRLIAGHLASKHYLPARDSKAADLLLVLTWGTTIPFDDAAQRANTYGMFSTMNQLNAANALVKKADEQQRASQAQTSPDGIQSIERTMRDSVRDAFEGQLIQTQMFDDMRTKADERNARLLGYASEINEKNDASRFAGAGADFDDLISDIENERYYVIISAYDYRVAAQEKKRKLLWATRVSIQAQGSRFKESLATMLANASPHFGQNSGRLIRQYQEGTVKLGELKILGTVPEPTLPAKPAQEK